MPKRYWYVILTYLIVQFSAIPVALFVKSFFIDYYTDVIIYWNIFSFIAGLFAVLYLMKPDMQMRADPEAATAGSIIGWSILGILLAFLVQYAAALIEVFILGIPAGSENTMQIMDIARYNPLFILLPAIIAPILEEIIFRKIIFGTLYKRMNFILAALLSGLIFGVIHMELSHLLGYTTMGMVFAFLYVKTKRIIVPIIVHAGMNSIVVIAQYSITPEEIENMQKMLDDLQMILLHIF